MRGGILENAIGAAGNKTRKGLPEEKSNSGGNKRRRLKGRDGELRTQKPISKKF